MLHNWKLWEVLFSERQHGVFECSGMEAKGPCLSSGINSSVTVEIPLFRDDLFLALL